MVFDPANNVQRSSKDVTNHYIYKPTTKAVVPRRLQVMHQFYNLEGVSRALTY